MSEQLTIEDKYRAAMDRLPPFRCGRLDMNTWMPEPVTVGRVTSDVVRYIYFDDKQEAIVVGQRADEVAFAASQYQPLMADLHALRAALADAKEKTDWLLGQPPTNACPDCGPTNACDEDGCCLMCGADLEPMDTVALWRDARALAAANARGEDLERVLRDVLRRVEPSAQQEGGAWARALMNDIEDVLPEVKP